MRVLLIEDDSETAQSIALMLKSESFNVYTTHIAQEGVDLGTRYDYATIQLDRGMDERELKIIDVFICKLRKKLANASQGKNYIETVWGRGYVLREPTEVEERIPA